MGDLNVLTHPKLFHALCVHFLQFVGQVLDHMVDTFGSNSGRSSLKAHRTTLNDQSMQQIHIKISL